MRHLHLACQDCQQYFITMFGRPNCIDSHFCLQNIDQLKREASNARVSKGEFTEHICLARGFAMHGWENRRQHLSTYGNPKGGDVMMMSCCAAISQASEVSGRVIISIVFTLIGSLLLQRINTRLSTAMCRDSIYQQYLLVITRDQFQPTAASM